MISECPHCNQNLRFSDSNKERILTALGKLPQGQTLKFKCPMCRDVIELNPDGLPASSELAGDSALPASIQPAVKAAQKYANTIAVPPPAPPEAPDISWLLSGGEVDSDLVENIKTAMVIVPDESMHDKIAEIIKKESYHIYIPVNINEAIESIRFKDYAIIVYHSRYENKPLNSQDFHKFMQQMSMNKRRYILYILVGPEFQTLYDLQALANSANVVVNDSEVPFLSTILTKLKSDYQKLFRSYCTLLKEHGRS
ncbi:MAG: hypothetical protein HQK61_08830 [Desulfamplus sp.]|nr:hypothetical protein [Desulfamplus sp.]